MEKDPFDFDRVFKGLRAPSHSQKGHVSKKMNVINDTKTLAKSAEGTGNICDRLWHLTRSV